MRKWIPALLCLSWLMMAAPMAQAVQPAGAALNKTTLGTAVQGGAAQKGNDDWGAAATPFDNAGGSDQRFEEQDPWEGFNRKVFGFNEFVDRWAIKPAAKGYNWITPRWLNDGITRVFQNLGDLMSGINSVLQWRWGNAGDDFSRFAINSTLGLAGMFDVASDLNIDKHSTGLDDTLATWGVHAGPYLVLPILGPSSIRDASTLYPSAYLWAPTYIEDSKTRLGVTMLYGIDLRADLLDLEKNIVGDRYTFIRDAYLQTHVFNQQGDGGLPPLPDKQLPSDSDEGW